MMDLFKKKFLLTAMLLAMSSVGSLALRADTVAAPCSYQQFSLDKRYFFVMLAPDNKREVECTGYSEERKAEARKLRGAFSVSGLYANSDPSKLLWQVDWFSYQVLVANDGEHVVRMGPWASGGADEAFAFVEDGKVRKTYSVNDLIDSLESLPHSVSHFEWKKEIEIDNNDKTLVVTTLENKRFVFNLATGELANRRETNTRDVGEKKYNSSCSGMFLLIPVVLSLWFAARAGA